MKNNYISTGCSAPMETPYTPTPSELVDLKLKLLAEHLKDVVIRLSALEGKSESGTVKSRIDDLTIRVETLEKGEEG